MSHDETFYCSFVSVDYIICECGETFPSEDDLRTHLEKEHPHKKERKEYKCGVCEKIYPTEQECVDHYEHSHIEIKLEHNYVVDPDKLEEYQEEEYQEEYKEEEYQEEEYKEEEYKEEEHTEDIQEADSQYEEVTEYVYTSTAALQPYQLMIEGHYTDVEDVSQLLDENVKIVKKGVKKYYSKNVVCEVCGKKYASNAALKYHQRVHTGERPYKCTMCPKTFTMPLFLKIHIRTHTGERPYECPYCPKAFSNKAALLRHDRVHSGVKPYPCPKCGKTFTQSNSMKLHVNTVHLKMPAPYKSKRRRLKEREAKAIKSMNGDSLQKVMIVKEEQNADEYTCEDEDVTFSLVYED